MIELKKLQLNEIYNFVNQIQLNKVTDASVRKTILKLVLELPKLIDNIQKDIDETRKKLLGEFEQTDLNTFQNGLNEIENLVRSGKVEESRVKDKELSEAYPEITKAYNIFIDSLNGLYNETVELNIDKVNIDLFIESMVGQSVNISGPQIALLTPIFENESGD